MTDWTTMAPLTFDPKCPQTQTAMLLVTPSGTTVAPKADPAQGDLFAESFADGTPDGAEAFDEWMFGPADADPQWATPGM